MAVADAKTVKSRTGQIVMRIIEFLRGWFPKEHSAPIRVPRNGTLDRRYQPER
jgi:hypothetical protein